MERAAELSFHEATAARMPRTFPSLEHELSACRAQMKNDEPASRTIRLYGYGSRRRNIPYDMTALVGQVERSMRPVPNYDYAADSRRKRSQAEQRGTESLLRDRYENRCQLTGIPSQ